MVDPSHTFHAADYVVFGATIVVSIGIGIYYALSGGRQRTTSEYLVGGRKMKFLPVAISLMVTFESSIMMLGLPAEMYVYGSQWWISTLGIMVAKLISMFVMVPLLHPLKITSAYEYLHLRFNSMGVRLLGTILGMLGYVWYMGIVLFGPAIALEAVTGFPQWGSIFIVAFVAVIYTSIGGLKAVVWTDVFQALIMYAGMMAILIKGTLHVGSPTKVWEIANKGGRINFFNFDLDPTVRHTFWSLFFGSVIRGLTFCFNQATIQRISATSTRRDAVWVLLIASPAHFLALTLACYEGIVAYAYYETKQCDPLASKKITNPNQIIPFTVMDIFMGLPGMPGLFLASLFSASLSTLSSGLSSLSALLWTDIVKPRIGNVSDFKATVIAKSSVVLFGIVGCGIAVLVSLMGGPLTQVTASLLAGFGGPLTGLFLLGCFFPMANAKGALLGGILSLIISTWLSMGKSFSKNVRKTPWLPPASTARCLANSTAAFLDLATSAANYTDMRTGFWNSSLPTFDGDGHGYLHTGQEMWTTPDGQSVLTSTTTPVAVDHGDGPRGIEVLYNMSYMWLAPVGIVLTLLLGTIISLLTGGNKAGEVHPRYLINFFDRLCCYLPEAIRKWLRCGDDYKTASYDDYNPPVKGTYLDTEKVVVPDLADQADVEQLALTEKPPTEHVMGNDVTNGTALQVDVNGYGDDRGQHGEDSSLK